MISVWVGGPGRSTDSRCLGACRLELCAGTRGLLPQVPPRKQWLLQEAFPEVLLSPLPISPCPIRFLPLLPWPLPFLGLGPGPRAPRHAEGKERKLCPFPVGGFPLGELGTSNIATPRTCCSRAGLGVGEGTGGLDSTRHILCPHLWCYTTRLHILSPHCPHVVIPSVIRWPSSPVCYFILEKRRS